ncbi:MAG: hypothetical protein OXF79_27540 [Chloroflexi bacterium]|nr:hypothetical protein [Chloroflexota bacterium]
MCRRFATALTLFVALIPSGEVVRAQFKDVLSVGTPGGRALCLTSEFNRPATDGPRAHVAASQERFWCAGLNYQQDPPVLIPGATSTLTLRDIGIVGDFPTIQFESDPVIRDGEWVRITETWDRTHTESVAGYTISYFTESWTAEEMVRFFGPRSFGVDNPNLGLGRLSVPGQPGALGQPEPYLMVRASPMVFSRVPVHRINDHAQYSSHLVNLRVDDFSVGRIAEGNEALRYKEAANLFFTHFEDEYDSIAFVLQRHEMGLAGGLFRTVRNDVEGIGLPVFDDSASYGSSGRLQGIEYYGAAHIANQHVASHELMHRWADHFKLHEIAGVDARGSHYPGSHMPLLFPHESFVSGTALPPHIEVVRSSDGGYRRAIVPAPRQHPLHLYAMGLAPASSVPDFSCSRSSAAVRIRERLFPAAHGSSPWTTSSRGMVHVSARCSGSGGAPWWWSRPVVC